MTPWQAVFFGLKQIPRELTAFEIEAFFTFTATERQVIEQRRQPTLKLGLALQIGFLRMSGRVLDAVRSGGHACVEPSRPAASMGTILSSNMVIPFGGALSRL
jgi:hypothetical protein